MRPRWFLGKSERRRRAALTMMHELFESLDGPKTDEQCYVEAWLWDRLGEHRVAQAIRDGLAREQTVRSH